MTQSTDQLVHWQYPADLWRDFVEFESNVYRKSVRSAMHFVVGTVVTAVLLIALVSLVPFLVTGKWNSNIWGPGFGIAFIASIFVAVGLFVWLLRRKKMERFRTVSGEAVIGLNQLNINDVTFSWTFDGLGWRYLGGERKMVSVDALRRIQILELKYVACIPDRGSPIWDFGEQRIPVPPGKEVECDRVLERLNAELAAAEEKWKAENLHLKHDFAGGVCRRCSSPIHQVVMRPWTCNG